MRALSSQKTAPLKMVTTENDATGTRGVGPMDLPRKLFNLLAGRDPIEVLGQTAFALADIVARHPAEIMRGRAIQGKWTPNEIIGHLTDSEWVYGYRLRLILCEDEPAILGFRQDAWVASLRHNEREPSALVEIFQTLARTQFVCVETNVTRGLATQRAAQ